MKTLKLLLVIAIACSSFATQAQTADEIISKHIDAIGGKDLLSKINTMSVDATVTAMGADYTTKITSINGKAFKNETDVNGSSIVQCVTDTGGWTMNPFMGQSDPTPMTAEELKAAKATLDVRGQLYNYKEKGSTATLLG